MTRVTRVMRITTGDKGDQGDKSDQVLHILHILQILHVLPILVDQGDQGAQGSGGGGGLQRLLMVGPTEGPAKTVHFGQSNVVLSWIWMYSSLEQIAQEKRLRPIGKPENLSLPFRSQDWLRKRQSVLRAVTLVTLMALSWIGLNDL